MKQSHFLRIANQRRSQGLCSTCGAPQPPERRGMWRCLNCVKKYRHRPKKQHEHDGPKRQSDHAGSVLCLNCSEVFHSEDRRYHRLCTTCQAKANYLTQHVACEEALA